MATEAAVFRGADAVAAGFAGEVTDLARGFTAYRQRVAGRSSSSIARARSNTHRQSITRNSLRKETARLLLALDIPRMKHIDLKASMDTNQTANF